MSKVLGQEKPSLEYLVHAGVKGMKWGVRKENPSGNQILNARYRQSLREQAIGAHEAESFLGTTAKSRSASKDAVRQIQLEYHLNEDRITAARMTRGERINAILMAGPAGKAAIRRNKEYVTQLQRDVDAARKRHS